MAQPHASSRWELSAPLPPRSMDNPALAGVPGKPRCQHCNTILADGRCVEPECTERQPLLYESDDESVAAASPAVLAREDCEHPDDAPPDEAIGQQHG